MLVRSCHSFSTINLTSVRQARLAASRNANDESEVDESHLNIGLFTYPILQAADIMVYKWVSDRSMHESSLH